MFYDNFIKACNLKGKTPSAALSEAGIDKSASTRWKSGKKPTDATLRKLADYFGVSPEDLTGNTGPAQRIRWPAPVSACLDPESLDVAAAYQQADERSRAMVRLALGLDDDIAIAARGGKVVKKPSPVSAETLDELSHATAKAAEKENNRF